MGVQQFASIERGLVQVRILCRIRNSWTIVEEVGVLVEGQPKSVYWATASGSGSSVPVH